MVVIPVRMMSETRARDGGVEQRAERDHPLQQLLAVEHVEVVDGAGQLAHLLAHVADRLVDRHVVAQPHVARVHQAAGVVLGVGEEGRHLAAGRLVEQRHQRLAPVERRRLDQVGGVVGRQAAQPRPLLARRHAQHDVQLIARLEAEEEVLRLVARQEQKRLDPIAVGQQRPDLADLPQRERFAVGNG